jgi:Lar family restriction alleviation protein
MTDDEYTIIDETTERDRMRAALSKGLLASADGTAERTAQDAESEPLRPCPFCGKDAVMKEVMGFGIRGGPDRMYYVVKCPECGASIGCFSEDREKVAARWNTRVGE